MDKESTLPFYQKYGAYLIPLISLIAGIIIFFNSPPFYLRHFSPEYSCLIDGLNTAMFRFGLIENATDPGTPFQFFCGFIIRITYMFAGRNLSITSDVLYRPEFYLSAISLSLTIIQVALLTYIGSISLKNIKLPYIIILQLTPFLNSLNLIQFARCTPERFLIISMLLFVIVWIRFVQDENLKTRKFAIWSGIILAIGLATRYSMLPVMILPLFLLSDWKSKGIYILSGIVSFAVIIAPVMGHLNGIAMFSSTGDNGISIITTIFSHPEIVLFLIVFALLLRIIQKGDDKKRKINFFSGFIVVIVLQVAWGLIHENSLFYFPLFLLYGIFLFETGQLVEKLIDSRTNRNILFGIIPSLLFLTGCIHFVNDKVKNHEKDNLMAEASSLIKNIDAGTYLYFKPTSKAMPVIANALIYAGVKCKEFENQYRKISQNLITLEGEGITESYWQCNEAPFDSLLKKGVKLYVLSSSNFEAERMIAGLYQLAKVANIELARDIIFEHEKKGIVINCISGLSEPTVFEKLIIEKPEVILQEKTINIEIEVKKWEKKIRENAIWMEEIKQKAEHRNIPVDSMLYLDALYQAQKEK